MTDVVDIKTIKEKMAKEKLIIELLAILSPREERVLRMRFGIGMRNRHTMKKIALQFNVTYERIRQIMAKSLKKINQSTLLQKSGYTDCACLFQDYVAISV